MFSKTKAGQKGVERAQAKAALPVPVQYINYAKKAVYKHQIKDLPKFRSSSLPYCPILYFRDTIEVHVNGPKIVPVTFIDEFYTTIGTAMHLVWQEMLSADNPYCKIFGTWKNKDTGEMIYDSFKPKCDEKISPWLYEEIEMTYKGLSCHLDGLFYYTKNNPDGGDYWVLKDLKTAKKEMIEKPNEHLPVIKNIFQQEAYMCIIEEEFGIRPKYYMLDYHARESHGVFHPYLVEWTDKKREVAFNRLDQWADSHALALNAVAPFSRMLASKPHSGKPYTPAAQAYSPAQAAAILTPLVESRPCHTASDYERIMQPCMVFEGGCRHSKLCTKQSGQRLVLSLLEAITPDDTEKK